MMPSSPPAGHSADPGAGSSVSSAAGHPADAPIPLVEGLAWATNGQVSLSGPLLALADDLDRLFRRLASRWDAVEHRFPPFIAVAELERLDWLHSFPHLATFPVCLDPGEDNLARFAGGDPVGPDGAVRFTELAPVRDVLTPAACYHLYVHYEGVRISAPLHLTTVNACFRREERYVPLERQSAFTMREIVCIGSAVEARAFLAEATASLDRVVASLGLPLTWAPATDPFFRPARNPAYVMQVVDPTKHELLFGGRLAVASANLHHDHFGHAFSMSRAAVDGGAPAHTACLAFGIERWLAAIVAHHGPDPTAWPVLEKVET